MCTLAWARLRRFCGRCVREYDHHKNNYNNFTNNNLLLRGIAMLFAIYVLVAIAVLILHFTGHLERWRMEWMVIVMAVTVFPAVIYL